MPITQASEEVRCQRGRAETQGPYHRVSGLRNSAFVSVSAMLENRGHSRSW
jgi:hypothetical protein